MSSALSLPSQISTKAAVAALRSLQAKLGESERERERASTVSREVVAERDRALSCLRRELEQEQMKKEETIRDLIQARDQADNLRRDLVEANQTITRLQLRLDQIHHHKQQQQQEQQRDTADRDAAQAKTATAAPSFGLNQADVAPLTRADLEAACALALERAERRRNPAWSEHVTAATTTESARIQTEADQLLAASSVPVQDLIDRCDKIEAMVVLYAKFMLKSRFAQRRPRAAAQQQRQQQVQRRALRRITSQCSALIDLINGQTPVQVQGRILDVLSQLDRVQAQLDSSEWR